MNRDERSNSAAAASLGSTLSGDAVQVDAPEDHQAGAEYEHRRGESEPGSDQGAPAVAGANTPRPISSSDSIGSTIFRSLISR